LTVTKSADYWREVENIFAEALGADPAERQALVESRAAGRDSLRAEVESLLTAHARLSPVPATDEHTRPPAATARRLAIGGHIGPFRLVQTVGTGGMATVFLAERDDGAFSQRVAIKLIAAPLTHPGTVRRFRAERQILASLRHPHIITLLDGGVTPDGQAYLVMEYVDGAPITAYCRQHALPLDARLRLFRQVCSAVHYAHRHFVVHRDLKPANILVTAEGVPKVLDFGVAKLLDDGTAPAAATVTAPGGGPLTPNYASPEQLRGLPVTTSSDVYALGVLLYELTSGVRPIRDRRQAARRGAAARRRRRCAAAERTARRRRARALRRRPRPEGRHRRHRVVRDAQGAGSAIRLGGRAGS
jgi:serine/threonine protein kinase